MCTCSTLLCDNSLYTIHGLCWQQIYRAAIFVTEAYDLKLILLKNEFSMLALALLIFISLDVIQHYSRRNHISIRLHKVIDIRDSLIKTPAIYCHI